MKKILYLPLLCLLLASSCEMENFNADLDGAPPNVTEVAVPASIRKGEQLELRIHFDKPSPCHQIKEVKANTTGLTVNYDVILHHNGSPCPTIHGIQDSVTAVFTPQQTGDHTLNFLVNNRLYLVRKVKVLP
jgi:hypothetical protein